MKYLSIAVLLNLIGLVATAQQNHQVKGTVTDTASNSKLYYATISILNAKDSTLYKFTRADEDGRFAINNMREGKFILLLTYPDYADYVLPFSLNDTTPLLDFRQIDMKSKARVLNEVLIKGQAAAIKIKGDTTEFNASSYNIQPNDKVEDLLKKLPGIQIDKDGKITAQGKSVPKVLVDGEEFFGDDPTLVTKNLRADMVDKVQLYEKASDQAAFTGVDDGNKTQTINIKLKEDMKKGYFGKVDGGYGTKDFYQAQGLFNYFKAKQKFSVYGTSSNNGTTGLGWEDSNRLGLGGDNIQMMDGGIMIMSNGGDDLDFGGGYYGEGIPIAHNGGAHYDSKWNNDKESINTNYKIGSLDVKTLKNTLNQNNLPIGVINSNTDETSDKYIFRQKLDVAYTIKLDTTSNLKVTVDGTLKNNTVNADRSAVSRRYDQSLLNSSATRNDNKGNEQIFNISALYTKKLKKAGRNYSLNLSQNIGEKSSTGFLFSQNDFYNNTGSLDSSNVVDQYKSNRITTSVFNSNLTYNEPLSKALALVLNYGIMINNSRADRKSFNQSGGGNYNLLDEEFTNDFNAKQFINQGGAVFNYRKPKTTITFGTKVNYVTFDQSEAYTQQSYNRTFVNWLPQASYLYKFNSQKSFRLEYRGNTTQPTVEQLQPVRVNNDPLNQPLGNPDLKPSYRNNFNMRYSSYKVLSDQSISFSGDFSFVNNQIVNNTVTDSAGKSVFQSINLNGRTPMNFGLYSGMGRKIKFLGIQASVNVSGRGSTSFNYVNNQLNETQSYSFNPSLGLSKYKDDFSFYFDFGPSYNIQKSSLQPLLTNEGWGYQGYSDVNYKFMKKYRIRASGEYIYNPPSAAFAESFQQIIVNASLTRSFFKKEELKLMLRVNDIFNQNSGFRRFASANNITQTSYNNINRYFMFSLIWDFNKMGATATK